MLFVLGLAAVALPIVGSTSALGAPGYRVIAIERLTSGAPNASPDLGLLAWIDDGAGGPAGYATGEVTWQVDRRQLGSGSIAGLSAAPAGTQFGWVTSGATGGTAVQLPLRKIGTRTEDGDSVIDAAVENPSEFAPTVGPTVPVTIRVRPDVILLTLNIQTAVGRFRASGTGDVIVDLVGLYLLGTYSSGGATQHLAVNPPQPEQLQLAATARPCADASCDRLAGGMSDSLSFSLPQATAVQAPSRAIYGQKATFRGTAAPGESVHIAYLRAPGADPVCTPTSVNALPACFPRFAATYDRLSETTTAGVDGRWSQSVVLRTVFANGALGLAHPASGRYAAVAYHGEPPPGITSFNGGRFSIFAAPETQTKVSLAKPRVTTRARGRKFDVSIAVPGGDPFVEVRVAAGPTTLAEGHLDVKGTFRAEIARRASTVLRVVASVEGAQPSTAHVALRRAN
jgi:hypothetical protein